MGNCCNTHKKAPPKINLKPQKIIDINNLILYFIDIIPYQKHLLSLKNNNITKIKENYIREERELFYKEDGLIEEYFSLENKHLFNTTIFIENNKNITEDFRYFALCFIFGYDSVIKTHFYYKIFPHVNKKFLTEFENDNMILNTLKFLKNSIDWILIIPCYYLPFIISELNTIEQIKIIIVHCHGKHIHKGNYFKSIKKYKGTFTNHNELISILININKEYILPKFNYDLKVINNYKKYDFEYSPNINSTIYNSCRFFYKTGYFDNEHISSTIKTTNHLLIKAYFHYKQLEERKINIENKDILSYFKYINIKPELSFKETKRLCMEFIPKFYLVFYYYISYIYSTPFKYNINDIDTSIDYSKKKKYIYKIRKYY